MEFKDFIFGVHRNDFYEKYHALAAVAQPPEGVKKRGREEIKLGEMETQVRELFTGVGGSDEKEWKAWLSKEACDVPKKAIYGFAEAARLFWLALKEHLESDGWKESRLEPALFYLRDKQNRLRGILVTRG